MIASGMGKPSDRSGYFVAMMAEASSAVMLVVIVSSWLSFSLLYVKIHHHEDMIVSTNVCTERQRPFRSLPITCVVMSPLLC